MTPRSPEFVDRLEALQVTLHQAAPLTIAVSGGVDSTTLACFAHRRLGRDRVRAVHASSAAVPKAALRRLRNLADAENWDFSIVDAGELADPNYRSNPINRCFFCKTNLYRALQSLSNGAVASGTNCDDLGDYRPGLEAARLHAVCHPYVTAGFSKDDVRSLALSLGLTDLAALPSSPCLSSRVETGQPIVEQDLRMIDAVETWLRARLGNITVRCRVRTVGIVVELDAVALDKLSHAFRDDLLRDLKLAVPGLRDYDVLLAPYRQGSAFVGDRTVMMPTGTVQS